MMRNGTQDLVIQSIYSQHNFYTMGNDDLKDDVDATKNFARKLAEVSKKTEHKEKTEGLDVAQVPQGYELVYDKAIEFSNEYGSIDGRCLLFGEWYYKFWDNSRNRYMLAPVIEFVFPDIDED